jgi:L-ascorbate metabolism protein UlaG (beta-lactamase superfamily)
MTAKLKKTMIIFFTIVLVLIGATFAFLRQPKFGKLPSGERLFKIEGAENYKNGSFQNLTDAPELPEGVTYWDATKKFLFGKKTDSSPAEEIPSIKTDLKNIDPDEDILVWFGHSSYFMQIDGKKILVDPVLSGSASPLPIGTKAFKGTDIYSTDDLPGIDILFISHDHWDHLDYETVTKLEPKIKKVICGLGVGEHFEYWGYEKEKIIETNWNEKNELPDGFTVHTLPARHFSGRGLKRNKTLWVSFVLQAPNKQIYIGGDSGYDSHFAQTGNTFGDFDLVILENGQYDEYWPNIHLMPDEILVVAKQLNAKRILPVHSSKFVLGNHPWYEPLELITQNSQNEKLNVITPMIGEPVDLNNQNQRFSKWWRTVKK